MNIVIASGKGGTGKTTIATNLALSVPNSVYLDCDVEEPNAHLFLQPKITTTTPVYKPFPQIDEEKCTYCGKCSEICAVMKVKFVHFLISQTIDPLVHLVEISANLLFPPFLGHQARLLSKMQMFGGALLK